MLAAMGVEHTIEHLTDDHLFSGAARFTPQMPALNACQIAAAVLIGAAQLAPCACRRSAVLTALLRCLPSHAPHPAQTLIIRIPFLAVDIALPEERIAIEVDGPHHFTTNTFRRLGEMYCRCAALAAGFRARFQFVAVQFGQTAAVRLRTSASLTCRPCCPRHSCRHTLLKARGWRVVSVPFYHWSGESGAISVPACLHAMLPPCTVRRGHALFSLNRRPAKVEIRCNVHVMECLAHVNTPPAALQTRTGSRCCGA